MLRTCQLRSATLWGACLLSGALLWSVEDSSAIRADIAQPMPDADADGLPDAAEWQLLMNPSTVDTDGDGVDDFLAAVQWVSPIHPANERPLDHELRVVLTTDPTHPLRPVWMHMLFRFVGGRIRDVQSFEPYVDAAGTKVPLQSLGAGHVEMRSHHHPTQGLLLSISAQIADENSLRQLLPATIGIDAVIAGRSINSGTYLQEVPSTNPAGAPTTEIVSFVPVDTDVFVLQSLAPEDNPFWSANRICLINLDVLSSTGRGHLCEVRSANCVSSGRLRCPPSCRQAAGGMVFVPDGMGTLTGGG